MGGTRRILELAERSVRRPGEQEVSSTTAQTPGGLCM